MSYTITKKSIAETPFLFTRRDVKPEAIAEALGAMFHSVFQYATAQGIPFAGPPTARYPRFGPGLITIEAGLPIAGPGAGEIELGSLAGGDVVTTIHKGPYDNLGQGHEAIQAWLEENHEESSGAPWETYVTTAVPQLLMRTPASVAEAAELAARLGLAGVWRVIVGRRD